MIIDRFSNGGKTQKVYLLSRQGAILGKKTLGVSSPRFLTAVFKKKRLTALFMCVVIAYEAIFPTAYALFVMNSQASADTPAATSTHKTSTTPSIGTINPTSPPVSQPQQSSKYVAAANAKPLIGDSSNPSNTTSFLNQVAGTVSDQPVSAAAPSSISKPTFTPHELVNDRTATSSMYLNKDGSITKTAYMSPHFYKSNGSWQPIDNTLVTDDNAADSGNIFGQALGAVESLVSAPNAFKTQANDWEARFTPSDFSGGMVRIEQGGSQVGFSPVNANTVAPVITKNSAGQQVVHYNNLWNGVDVEYTVGSDQVKEAVIISNKQAASQVQFKVIGANLQKPTTASTPGDPQPAFTITGALGNQFGVTPANLVLNHYRLCPTRLPRDSHRATRVALLTVGVANQFISAKPPPLTSPSQPSSTLRLRARSVRPAKVATCPLSRAAQHATRTRAFSMRATATTPIATGRVGTAHCTHPMASSRNRRKRQSDRRRYLDTPARNPGSYGGVQQ